MEEIAGQDVDDGRSVAVPSWLAELGARQGFDAAALVAGPSEHDEQTLLRVTAPALGAAVDAGLIGEEHLEVFVVETLAHDPAVVAAAVAAVLPDAPAMSPDLLEIVLATELARLAARPAASATDHSAQPRGACAATEPEAPASTTRPAVPPSAAPLAVPPWATRPAAPPWATRPAAPAGIGVPGGRGTLIVADPVTTGPVGPSSPASRPFPTIVRAAPRRVPSPPARRSNRAPPARPPPRRPRQSVRPTTNRSCARPRSTAARGSPPDARPTPVT